MTHIPLPVVFLVFTVAAAAMIIIANQVPLPDWYTKLRVEYGRTPDGVYYFSTYTSYRDVAKSRSTRDLPIEIKGVHLKSSKIPDELLGIKLPE